MNSQKHIGVRKKAYELALKEIGVGAIDQLDTLLSAIYNDPTERGRTLLKVIEADSKKSLPYLAYVMCFYDYIALAEHEIPDIRLTKVQSERYRAALQEEFNEACQSIILVRADLIKSAKTFWSLIRDQGDENARVFLLTELLESKFVPFTEFVGKKQSERQWDDVCKTYFLEIEEFGYLLKGHQPAWTDVAQALEILLEVTKPEDKTVLLARCLRETAKFRGSCKCSQVLRSILE